MKKLLVSLALTPFALSACGDQIPDASLSFVNFNDRISEKLSVNFQGNEREYENIVEISGTQNGEGKIIDLLLGHRTDNPKLGEEILGHDLFEFSSYSGAQGTCGIKVSQSPVDSTKSTVQMTLKYHNKNNTSTHIDFRGLSDNFISMEVPSGDHSEFLNRTVKEFIEYAPQQNEYGYGIHSHGDTQRHSTTLLATHLQPCVESAAKVSKGWDLNTLTMRSFLSGLGVIQNNIIDTSNKWVVKSVKGEYSPGTIEEQMKVFYQYVYDNNLSLEELHNFIVNEKLIISDNYFWEAGFTDGVDLRLNSLQINRIIEKAFTKKEVNHWVDVQMMNKEDPANEKFDYAINSIFDVVGDNSKKKNINNWFSFKKSNGEFAIDLLDSELPLTATERTEFTAFVNNNINNLDVEYTGNINKNRFNHLLASVKVAKARYDIHKTKY